MRPSRSCVGVAARQWSLKVVRRPVGCRGERSGDASRPTEAARVATAARERQQAARRADPPPAPGRGGRRGVRQRRRHRGPEGAAVSERRPSGAPDRVAARPPRRAGHDQAPGGGRGAAGVDLLPHVSGITTYLANGGRSSTLATLHEAGDVKPTNVGLTSNGAPKLLDFGLARAANDT